MSRNNKCHGKGFAWGTLVGGVIGGVTALLFAPKSGEKMRKDIGKKYGDMTHKAQDLMEDVCDQTQDLVKRAKTIAEDAKDCAAQFIKKRK